jgi:AmpE protein
MIFIVTFVALIIERFFDWSHLRHWSWYAGLRRFVQQKLPGKSAYLLIAVDIVPLLIVVFILKCVLSGLLFGVVGLAFDLVVFLYCLGPQNLWADSFASMNALSQGDAASAVDKLKITFNITEATQAQMLPGKLLNSIFIASNSRIFAVLFWYVCLGPVGAVLYRAVTLTLQDTDADVVQKASQADELLNWLPERVFTFIFALSGQFVDVLSCWRKRVLLGLTNSNDLLTECGRAAIGLNDDKLLTDDVFQKAISLLDRSFIIALVLVLVVWVA